MRQTDRKTQLPNMIILIVLMIIIIAAFNSLNKFWTHAGPERLNAVKDAVQKAAVQCYALEGSYPPDLNYMVKHYGLIMDSKRFYYRYEVFASNILPEIEVFER